MGQNQPCSSLALAFAPGLDWGFVHRLDPRAADRRPLYVAAGTLRQTMGDLLADHLIGVGLRVVHLRVGHHDGLHRHARIEEQCRLAVVIRALGADAALVGIDGALRRGVLGWRTDRVGLV